MCGGVFTADIRKRVLEAVKLPGWFVEVVEYADGLPIVAPYPVEVETGEVVRRLQQATPGTYKVHGLVLEKEGRFMVLRPLPGAGSYEVFNRYKDRDAAHPPWTAGEWVAGDGQPAEKVAGVDWEQVNNMTSLGVVFNETGTLEEHIEQQRSC